MYPNVPIISHTNLSLIEMVCFMSCQFENPIQIIYIKDSTTMQIQIILMILLKTGFLFFRFCIVVI